MNKYQSLEEVLGANERVFIEEQPDYEFLRYVSSAIYTFSPGIAMPTLVRFDDILAAAIAIRETNDWIMEYRQMLEVQFPETDLKVFWQDGDQTVAVIMVAVTFGPNTYRFYLNYHNPQHWVWFSLIMRFSPIFICFAGESHDFVVSHMDESFAAKFFELEPQFNRMAETKWSEEAYKKFKEEIAIKYNTLANSEQRLLM